MYMYFGKLPHMVAPKPKQIRMVILLQKALNLLFWNSNDLALTIPLLWVLIEVYQSATC